MKKIFNPAILPIATLAAGILAMLMRFWLFGLGTDDRGLLPASTFPDVASWIISGIVMVMLIFGTLGLREASKYRFNFPASIPSAIGTALGALGIFLTCFIELLSGAAKLGVFSTILGLFATAALAFLAYCRKVGRKPMFLFHAFTCIYLMFHLISHYRIWSAYPQLQTYAFELLAIVFLMLACYQRAAFDAGRGNRKAYAFCTLAALFFCLAAIPGSATAIFYIGCAAWMFTTLCNLKPLKPSGKNEQ